MPKTQKKYYAIRISEPAYRAVVKRARETKRTLTATMELLMREYWGYDAHEEKRYAND